MSFSTKATQTELNEFKKNEYEIGEVVGSGSI